MFYNDRSSVQQFQTMVGNKVTIDEANAFTQSVKNTFQNEREKYEEFVDALKDSRAHSAVTRLKDVFKDHQELILGFATLLPSGYSKTTLERKEKKLVTFEDACIFVQKVEERFKGNDARVYKAFIRNLEMYVSGNKSPIDVCHQFGILLWDHPDLLVELDNFPPASSKGSSSSRSDCYVISIASHLTSL